MGLEFLLCFLLAIVITGGRSASDIIHAAKGTTPPRIERARMKAAARPTGPGATTTGPFRLYAATVWADAWADAKAHHDRARTEKKAGIRPTAAQRTKRLWQLVWEPVGERKPDSPSVVAPIVDPPDPWTHSQPIADAEAPVRVDPLGLAGRIAEPQPKPAASAPDQIPTANNGGSPVTAPTGEIVNYETHKAELAGTRQEFQTQMELAAAALTAVGAAKAALNAQAEHARQVQAASQAKADSLAGRGLDGETQAHAGLQVDAVDPNRLDAQYEALEEMERDAEASQQAAEAGLAAVDAEEATIDAKYGDAAATVAAELGGDAGYLDSAGSGAGSGVNYGVRAGAGETVSTAGDAVGYQGSGGTGGSGGSGFDSSGGGFSAPHGAATNIGVINRGGKVNVGGNVTASSSTSD